MWLTLNIFKKNLKIYTFLLGIIVGTIVFNVISVDFSFEDIYNIKINDFIGNFIFVILYLIKYIIFYSILMIIKEKNVVAAFLLFAQGLYFSGLITIIVYTQNYICICGIIILITKIAIILTLFSEIQLRKKVLYVFVIVIMGGFLENILIFLLWKNNYIWYWKSKK